jgi:hypothetical protein
MKKPPFGLEKVDPLPVSARGFNSACQIPYGLTVQHIHLGLSDYIDFLTFINEQLIFKEIPRLETFIMPAGFSSLVGEFMNVRLPIYCNSLVKNRYHNGHPDLIPAGRFPDDAVQHDTVGIEVKGSRNRSGWQGHNPENVWLMVFIFDANSANDEAQAIKKGREPKPRPFRFVEVLGAQLDHDDWQFSGRSETSRRTITATVKPSGYAKMAANWIYRDPAIKPRRLRQSASQSR